ncbi:MAG: hypothetical protein J6U21_16385 [Bacteroidales bacterium]|nr:hypothetical protein [Bacteroidales bacterium]
MEATEKQIADWKKKHGEVYKVTVDGKSCYLHKPDRKTLAYVSTAKDNPIRMSELMLNNCWIDGDEEIKTDDALFLGVVQQMGTLISIKQAELVKL